MIASPRGSIPPDSSKLWRVLHEIASITTYNVIVVERDSRKDTLTAVRRRDQLSHRRYADPKSEKSDEVTLSPTASFDLAIAFVLWVILVKTSTRLAKQFHTTIQGLLD